MPVYLGLPLHFLETFRILGIDYTKTIIELVNKNNLKNNDYVSPYIYDELNNYLKNKDVNLRIYNTDKGQIILGYEIHEPSDVWDKFTNVDEFITLLGDLKIMFNNEIKKLDGNLEKVIIHHMEGEDEIVNFPIPYIISYR